MFSDNTPQYWHLIATHDIESVRQLIDSQGFPDIIIYHMHQAIEKLLKGHIIKNTVDVPRIHDLERLYSILVAKVPQYSEIKKSIYNLHSFYGDFRYPKSDLLNEKDLSLALTDYNIILKELLPTLLSIP